SLAKSFHAVNFFKLVLCPRNSLGLWNEFREQDWKNYFDMILTDNQMPGMTGLEFLDWIKQNNCPLPHHRKAIISGLWRDKELKTAQSLGCHIFHKPAPIETIHSWALTDE
ncbi:MAG: response regulator, partial [Desulfuromonadales bacterium]|nr:response regulator [Desulfuromonadales bacterium]